VTSSATATTSTLAKASLLSSASATRPPLRWASFALSLRAANPDALASDDAFVCSVRSAFASIAVVPLSAVRVVELTTDAGAASPVLVSQAAGACGGGRRAAGASRPDRRAQSASLPLQPVGVEVEVEVSRSSLAAAGADPERAVRAAVSAVFAGDASAIDALFGPATLAACAAQGITPDLCPNPPSFALTFRTPSIAATAEPAASAVVDVRVLASGGILAAACAVIVLAALLIRSKMARFNKVAPSDVSSELIVRHVVEAVAPAAPVVTGVDGGGGGGAQPAHPPPPGASAPALDPDDARWASPRQAPLQD
jgi:hypothetical protein